jgi:Transposase and inactivated derivatives
MDIYKPKYITKKQRPLGYTLRKKLNGVINAAKSSYSNGPIEGINRKIKELKRTCYGFSNQANMFTRVYQLIA